MTGTPAAERARAYRVRMRAAGFRLVHGRFTDAPIVQRQRADRAHGDHRRYWNGCRCPECRTAINAYKRDLAARKAHR